MEERICLHGRLLHVQRWMSLRNSLRVAAERRNEPSMAEVTMQLFCFSTPRIIMQR